MEGRKLAFEYATRLHELVDELGDVGIARVVERGHHLTVCLARVGAELKQCLHRPKVSVRARDHQRRLVPRHAVERRARLDELFDLRVEMIMASCVVASPEFGAHLHHRK